MQSPSRERPTNPRRKSVSTARADDKSTTEKHPDGYEDGRITVSVRVRPLNSREAKLGTGSCITALSAYNTLYILPPTEAHQDVEGLLAGDPQLRGVSHHRFTFDHVYPTDATQEQVYAQVGRPVLQSSFRGYHTCIFAYGQTGSGKSYCMMGADGGRAIDDSPGIIPRLCREMFAEMATRQGAAAAGVEGQEPVEYSVYVSYLEIYRERVRSLLDEAADAKVAGVKEPSTPRSTVNALRRTAAALQASDTADGHLRVREHPTLGVYVEGLAEIPVTTVDQVLRLMVRGNHRRHTASTRMNDTSSRSHAIFTIQLIQRRHHTLPASTTNDDVHPERSGAESTAADVAAAVADSTNTVMTTTQLGAKINLVDLAGSERAKATGAEGDTLREGAQINKSLTTLGIVINALAAQSTSGASSPSSSAGGKRHIPYRDSTLTFLLKESLGGNSKTFMIATVSPSTDSYDESVSTLRYADRAKAIVMRAFVNETAGDKRIRELEEEVTRLRERIQALLEAEAKRASAAPAPESSPSLALSLSQTPVLLADSESVPQAGHSQRRGEGNADTASDASHNDSGATDLDGVVADAADGAATPPSPVENADDTTRQRGGSLRGDEGGSDDVGGGPFDVTPPASPSAASPTEPREALVDTLQGELRRAEELIRQMSVTQAERDAHIAKLVEEQERERAAMRSEAEAAAAAARQEAEKVAAAAAAAASPVQTSTVRRNRDEPYLLNMDGAGDWVLAHLGPVQTLVGVFHSRTRKRAESAGQTAATDSEDNARDAAAAPRSPAESYDSSLCLPSSDDYGSHAASDKDDDRNAESSSFPAPDCRYVRLPPELSDGVGGPHCILERSSSGGGGAAAAVSSPTGTAGSTVVTLRGCGDYETVVLRLLCPAPFIVKGGGDALQLQSGDVLDIGHEHIQLKYIDPTAPPVTARGRRTVPLAIDRAISPTSAMTAVKFEEATGSDGAMSSLASQGHRPEAQLQNVPSLPLDRLRTDPGAAGGGADNAAAVNQEDEGPDRSSPARSLSGSDRRDASASESEPDSGDSEMNSPAEQPGGRAIELPARPHIPSLALGKALPGAFPHSQQQRQHADPYAGGAMSVNDNTTATTSTTDGDDGDAHASASMPSSEWTAPSSPDLHATSSSTNASRGLTFAATADPSREAAASFKSRKPSKRAAALAAASSSHAVPHAALSLPELQSMRASAVSSTYRSELPAQFVGRYNVVLVGPSGGGKTALVNNLAAPDKAWLRSAFSAFTGGGSSSSSSGRDGAFAGGHPTIGVLSKTLNAAGPTPMSLYTHELGGTPCFSPLLDQLPSHRVTYLLCFPLHGLTSLMTLRGVVEDILCRTDSHTVSLVLVGTHADRNAAGKEDGSFFSRLPTARQEVLHRQLEEVEQQVVSLIQMLQPYAQLRPTVVGRFAVDNVHRNIYTTGYQAVEGFPQWLQWLADLARDRCRADADFANGLVPARCLELGRQVSLLRQHGKWCVSLRDFKTLAAAVSAQYRGGAVAVEGPTRTPSQLTPALARDSLRSHVQLLADWGVLMHRYRSLQLRQHIILDVIWLSRLLAALACCPLIAAAESDGLSQEEAATLIEIVGEEGTMSLTRKEAALRTLLTPEAECVVDMVKVATTDTPHLLRCGVLSIPVLIAMLEPHVKRAPTESATGGAGGSRNVVVGRMVDNTSASERSLSLEGFLTGRRTSPPPAGSSNNSGGTVTRYAVPLAGVVELLVLLDLVVLGSKLSFSPTRTTGLSAAASLAPSTSKQAGSSSPVGAGDGRPRESAKAANATAAGDAKDTFNDSDANGDDVAKESFVLYPLSFRTPASAGVTWLFPCFLSGPFYVFKLDMVPRNFFPKLLCRLATVADKIYLGPVEEKLWGSATQRWANDPARSRSAVDKRSTASGMSSHSPSTAAGSTKATLVTATVAGPFDDYFEQRAGTPFALPSFSPYLASTTADGRLRRRDGFWFDAAWLLYDNGETGGDGKVGGSEGEDQCRVLVRLVHHSVFLSFHCHSVAAPNHTGGNVGGGGGRASPAVQDFYEAVLEAVRYVVEEFPGGRCVESMQCCVDAASLLQSEQQHPAMQTDQEAAAQDRCMRFANISDNINNLDRVLARSGTALRTARTARRPNSMGTGHSPAELGCGDAADDEDASVPLLRHFSETPALSIHECIRRWKSEQRLYIAPDVEARLTAALHALEECYHGVDGAAAAAGTTGSCAKLDYLLDVLARVDTI